MIKKLTLVFAMLTALGFGVSVLAFPATCEDCLAWRTSAGQSCAAALSFCEQRYDFGTCPSTCF